MQKYSQIINQELINFHPVTGREDDEFVGIKHLVDKIQIHYPESYHLTFDNHKVLRNEILDLISSIELGNHNGHYYDISNTLDNTDNTPITSMVWILKDFISNGLYNETQSVYKNNLKGKVNWKLTINKTLSKSNRMPLADTIVSENKIAVVNIIADLHFEALKTAAKHLGWLFNLDSRIFDAVKINFNHLRYYIHFIDTEIHRTFNDVQRIRLMHIRNVLKRLGGDSKGIFSYGTTHYNYVFETLVDRVFGNLSDKRYNPGAKWYLNDNVVIKTNTLRPDTIFTDSNRFIIIDSKYYRYGSTFNPNHLPNVDSIQKQTTYLEFIKTNYPSNKDICTAFFIPYDKCTFGTEGSDLEYIGYAISDWKTTSISAADYSIHTYLIDLKSLIKTWKSGNYERIRSEFTNKIYSYINS